MVLPVTHPVIEQLRFTRGEWLRGLEGVTEEDAARHFGPMNSIGWIVGHLSWQEQRYLLHRPQGHVAPGHPGPARVRRPDEHAVARRDARGMAHDHRRSRPVP